MIGSGWTERAELRAQGPFGAPARAVPWRTYELPVVATKVKALLELGAG